MNKCLRCGNIAEIETIQGWFLCSACECIFNNILNDVNEKRTLKEFEEEFNYNYDKGGLKE